MVRLLRKRLPLPTRSLRVILSDGHPTYFQNKITGEASGFAVEVTNEIAKRAGLEISYIFAADWEEIRQKVLLHEAEIAPG